ncbi:MAG: TIGR02757 family protein [Flavobacteriales bacterium]|nr:TIGR02757 family protein [Flavobacteriales bacterium]
MTSDELKSYLDQKYSQYNSPEFIREDPILIPHRFSMKEDIEISAFLAAIIAWGQRKTIIRNASKLVELMDDRPYDFLMHAHEDEFGRFSSFVHRTFNGIDCQFFIKRLSQLYRQSDGLEGTLGRMVAASGPCEGISAFKQFFFSVPHQSRSEKHLADPLRGSSAKRINMFLRWMVRKDEGGVDFGIWKHIPQSMLSIPLDVHTGNVARSLGLLKRKQNDQKAVMELDRKLREFDTDDPVKYDFALFGIGVYEDF